MMADNPLGRSTDYPQRYAPERLHAIARADSRAVLGIGPRLPFSGTDIWNAWDLTWLDAAGVPQVATLEIAVPAESPCLIESKSLKLYLGSLAMTRYDSGRDVTDTITRDLGACVGTAVDVELRPAADTIAVAPFPGICIDGDSQGCDTYSVAPQLLVAQRGDDVSETLHSHLLRSLCPVTGQPDIGSVLISYCGPRIDRAGLLAYIVSFRQHQDFHEACVERMYVDIRSRCRAKKLTVYARYQRRGSIDINPWRSNFESRAANTRLWRQ